jgi:ATP-dependent Zn protease
MVAEGNQFIASHVGVGTDKVHELFRTARKYAPTILFIDEIDAIAKERKGGVNAGANGEDTLTAFLTEMDGFANDPSRPVFVLAATNFEVQPGTDRSLDPALMRRFDRRVYVDLPDKEDRIKFLRKKIEKNHALQISENQIDNISVRATGMSLAELDSVIELALRSAIREGSTVVNDAILEEAFETFNGGEVEKWDASQLERVARHEAGHAFICWMSGESPSYLTVVARGNYGGYMQHAEQEGKKIYTKDELLAKIRTSLGGRASEIVYYGENDGISTGASGDLASATSLAQRLICNYGMDDNFGLAVVFDAVAANGTMSVEIRDRVNFILKEQMSEAIRIISENKDKVDALVNELLIKNHLSGAEIEKILTN